MLPSLNTFLIVITDSIINLLIFFTEMKPLDNHKPYQYRNPLRMPTETLLRDHWIPWSIQRSSSCAESTIQ